MRSDEAFSRVYYSFQAIVHCTKELINQVSQMIKSNLVTPRSEMQVYSEKDSYVKADLCVGFGFDNNEICASRSIKPF